jgi:hypothetical protein
MFGNMPTIRAMITIACRFEKENYKPINPASISAEQLEVLRALTEKDQIWRYGNASILLGKFGLPNALDDMLQFIEKAKVNMDIT